MYTNKHISSEQNELCSLVHNLSVQEKLQILMFIQQIKMDGIRDGFSSV